MGRFGFPAIHGDFFNHLLWRTVHVELQYSRAKDVEDQSHEEELSQPAVEGTAGLDKDDNPPPGCGLVDRLVDSIVDRLVDSIVDRLVDRIVDRIVDRLVDWLVALRRDGSRVVAKKGHVVGGVGGGLVEGVVKELLEVEVLLKSAWFTGGVSQQKVSA